MVEIKEDIKELSIESHNLSKRVYEVEKTTAVLSNDFINIREKIHEKFQVLHETMKALNERDEQQMKDFLKFKSDVEKQLNEKRIIGKFVYGMLKLWPLWLVVFLFLVFLDVHKFATHLFNFA